MNVTAYPVRGKAKSLDICRAFVNGCGGIVMGEASELQDGPAFFYGIDASNAHTFRQARERGDYLYADNAYFDSTRQSYFRVTKNRLQHTGRGGSDGKRFDGLGIAIKPWQSNRDGHIVICPQSAEFMKLVANYPRDWFCDTVAALDAYKRHFRVRVWDRDKTKLAATLSQDLVGARALVTWSSAAAITAIVNGIPAISMSNEAAAATLGGSVYRMTELPTPPREQWCAVLADNQWTVAEMANGTAWEMLQ